MLRSLLKLLLPYHVRQQLRNFHTLAIKYGQYRTLRTGSSVNRDGDPIPWYTYPAIEFLNQFDFSHFNAFEYGSGNSSKYWANRCNSVISVEHDPEWFAEVNQSLGPNQSLILAEEKEDYVQAITRQQQTFELIVIDGVHRQDCARKIDAFLNKETGIVILDNSDWYAATAKYLKETLGLIQLDFHGFTPINDYTSTTSILMTRSIDLVAKAAQPAYSLAANRHSYDH